MQIFRFFDLVFIITKRFLILTVVLNEMKCYLRNIYRKYVIVTVYLLCETVIVTKEGMFVVRGKACKEEVIYVYVYSSQISDNGQEFHS